MWECIRCHAKLTPAEAEPNVDDFGAHFICPLCGRRNRLRILGRDADGCLLLEQIDPPD
jgi:predicted RNA-binding Zn-ribbon protein involved in translation (DUF1610 family)